MGSEAITKLFKDNPGMLSVRNMSEKYGIHRQRMRGVILHPSNAFPEPKVFGNAGRIRLYCEQEVSLWLAGRNIRSLPFEREEVFYKNRVDKPTRPALPLDDEGVGGKAVGWHVNRANDFYRALDTVRGRYAHSNR